MKTQSFLKIHFKKTQVILNYRIINVDIEPLVKLNYEINKIGVNINQVIKLANQNNEINQSDINEIKALMIKLESLKEIASFFGENNINGIH